VHPAATYLSRWGPEVELCANMQDFSSVSDEFAPPELVWYRVQNPGVQAPEHSTDDHEGHGVSGNLQSIRGSRVAGIFQAFSSACSGVQPLHAAATSSRRSTSSTLHSVNCAICTPAISTQWLQLTAGDHLHFLTLNHPAINVQLNPAFLKMPGNCT